jgi:hypothetical protein
VAQDSQEKDRLQSPRELPAFGGAAIISDFP